MNKTPIEKTINFDLLPNVDTEGLTPTGVMQWLATLNVATNHDKQRFLTSIRDELHGGNSKEFSTTPCKDRDGEETFDKLICHRISNRTLDINRVANFLCSMENIKQRQFQIFKFDKFNIPIDDLCVKLSKDFSSIFNKEKLHLISSNTILLTSIEFTTEMIRFKYVFQISRRKKISELVEQNGVTCLRYQTIKSRKVAIVDVFPIRKRVVIRSSGLEDNERKSSFETIQYTIKKMCKINTLMPCNLMNAVERLAREGIIDCDDLEAIEGDEKYHIKNNIGGGIFKNCRNKLKLNAVTNGAMKWKNTGKVFGDKNIIIIYITTEEGLITFSRLPSIKINGAIVHVLQNLDNNFKPIGA